MGPAAPTSESRIHERHPLAARVRVLPPEGEALLATAQNISFGGVALTLLDGALPVGVAVEVRIDELGLTPLTGTVCWRRGDEVGIRFDELRRAARLALADLVLKARSPRA